MVRFALYRTAAHLVLTAALAACASAPPPAMVDESRKRPANDPRELERLRCTAELTNTQIELKQALRSAERNEASATEARLDAMRAEAAARTLARPASTQVYTVLFGFNATAFTLSERDAAQLLLAARSAEWIALRGRTDGVSDTPGEARVARARAEAMQTFLVRGGIDPSRIGLSYQPSGDTVASNADEAGRALNRRVEVELYAVRPLRAPTTVLAERAP